MVTIFVFMLFLVSSISYGATDVCYPGLDCPADLPSHSPRRMNPPPIQQQQTIPPPGPTIQENCTNPQAALFNQLYGGLLYGQPSTSTCSKPATHCCFDDGSALPLLESGVQFGQACHANINWFGIPLPVNGLACRR